ncbi:MAG: restriction endonuclease subunit S [Treponema sp.]|nr:restriction endonuclease subunit S [Treponema sp.]
MKTENLKKYKLGEILDFFNGKQCPKNIGKYPLYGGNGIIDYVDEYNYDDNIIIGRVGANCGCVQICNEKCWVSDNAISVKVKSDFDKQYIFQLLKTLNLNTKHVGAAQPLITQNILSELIVRVPPLESQQKIAAVLTALDDKIALNRRMNAKLEQMAKRLYDHWFVQFDFPNADGKPYKSSGGKMEYNEILKREIPAGWEAKKLGKLFTTNRGVSYSTKTITGDIGIPMINLASFSPDGSYKIDGIKLYTGKYTQEKVLKPFDLVMCNTQQTAIDFSKDIIGKALLVPDIFEGDITSSHHVNTLKVHNEKLKFYLYRLFNTDYFHAYISHFASGTNIMGLDFAGVENYTTVIPNDEILSKFADFTLNIEKKKSEIIRENTKLISLRDRLLPLLMNGQVEVK